MIPHCGSDLLFPNDTEHLFIYLLAIYMAFLKYVSSDPLCTRSLQLSPTLYDPMDCGPPGSSVHGDSPGKNIEVGIFTTQDMRQKNKKSLITCAPGGDAGKLSYLPK